MERVFSEDSDNVFGPDYDGTFAINHNSYVRGPYWESSSDDSDGFVRRRRGRQRRQGVRLSRKLLVRSLPQALAVLFLIATYFTISYQLKSEQDWNYLIRTSYVSKSWILLRLVAKFILWHMVGSLILYHEKYVGRGATLCCQLSFLLRFSIMFFGLI